MRKTFVLIIILVLLTANLIGLTKQIKAQVSSPNESLKVITINSNGSITPATTPIQLIGNVYRLTANIFNETITILRNDITLDGAGFTIQGFTQLYQGIMTSYPANSFGIELLGVSNVTVENFNIYTFSCGIKLTNSQNNTITRNAINAPTCIELASSNGNQIVGNSMLKGQTGYGIDGDPSYTNITGNIFLDIGTGVNINNHLNYGGHNIISQNIFNNNNYGINLVGSYNTVSNNSIVGGLSGIGVADYDDLILGNTIMGTTQYGILITQGQYNKVIENYFANNSIGIEMGYQRQYSGAPQAANNAVYLNNFINNTKNANIDTYIAWNAPFNSWDNGSIGNYWSDYNGTDVNGSGIGNTPYNVTVNNVDNNLMIMNNVDHYPVITPLNLNIIVPTPPPLPPSPLPLASPTIIPNPTTTGQTPPVPELHSLTILTFLSASLLAAAVLFFRRVKVRL